VRTLNELTQHPAAALAPEALAALAASPAAILPPGASVFPDLATWDEDSKIGTASMLVTVQRHGSPGDHFVVIFARVDGLWLISSTGKLDGTGP
jgi:hypothetical protein